jgi:DNA-binding NtrC family response regulator
VAEAVFYRGQTPEVSGVGAVVENDLRGSIARVRDGWTGALDNGRPPWAMVFLDLCFYTGRVTEDSNRRTPGMPEGSLGDDDFRSYFGLTLLDAIHRDFPEIPLLILSSKPREEVSLEFSRRGALGFIARDDLRGPALLNEALWQHALLPDPAGEVVGNSLAVLLALREARRAVRHRENLLIRGERGSGKELLASYIHRVSISSEAQDKPPFITVNAAVLTPHLFASELFGIEPKTATGVDGKVGLIELASGGDLFLDEIADMPSEVQAAVLRVLQERRITRVGGRQPKDVDVRFLSATNAHLEDENRGFRLDLLDRLRLGGTLWLPSLRERPTDIPLLGEKFVREAEAQRSGTMRRQITPEVLQALRAYDWPGNVRELRSAIFDAVHRHPDVEYLVAGHLRLGLESEEKRARESARKSTKNVPGEHQGKSPNGGLSALLACVGGASFDAADVGQWAGKLGELQLEYARLICRMIQAALNATKRRTPENPEGIIQIHPAAKLITGDSSLTASRAADLLKRLLGPLEYELEGDLRAAYDIAVRLRPKSAGAVAHRTTNYDT